LLTLVLQDKEINLFSTDFASFIIIEHHIFIIEAIIYFAVSCI